LKAIGMASDKFQGYHVTVRLLNAGSQD
jgi:hypothetical protein